VQKTRRFQNEGIGIFFYKHQKHPFLDCKSSKYRRIAKKILNRVSIRASARLFTLFRIFFVVFSIFGAFSNILLVFFFLFVFFCEGNDLENGMLEFGKFGCSSFG
jgi:predicted PurR-regulated permease PerM